MSEHINQKGGDAAGQAKDQATPAGAVHAEAGGSLEDTHAGTAGEPTTARIARVLRSILRVRLQVPDHQIPEALAAVKAGADALDLLRATRQQLTDLQGEHELAKAQFTHFAEEASTAMRVQVAQLEEMAQVVSRANADAERAREQQQAAEARYTSQVERLRQAIRDAIPHVPYPVEQDLLDALDLAAGDR